MMGKKLSTCCKGGSSPYKQKESQYNLTAAIQYDETMSSLQHISEREPMDDADYDPSTNPTAGPLFLERFENSKFTILSFLSVNKLTYFCFPLSRCKKP